MLTIDVPPKTSRLKKAGAGAVALAVATIGGFEGLRQSAYPDPATRGAPWTICYGHTGPDVAPGRRASLEECQALLRRDLDSHLAAIDACLPADMPPGRLVASLSLAFNIGAHGFCKSSVSRHLRAGRVREGCDAFLRFNRAAGVVFPGLTRRRERERDMCLEGA